MITKFSSYNYILILKRAEFFSALCILPSGICLSASWNLHVDDGTPCVIWPSHRMESAYWRRQHCSLPGFLFHKLVICMKIQFACPAFSHLNIKMKGLKGRQSNLEGKRSPKFLYNTSGSGMHLIRFNLFLI